MKSVAGSFKYSPEMDLDIKYVVKSWITCQQNEYAPPPTPPPPAPHYTPGIQTMATAVHRLRRSVLGKIIPHDHRSKYYLEMINTLSNDTITLQQIFDRFRLPEQSVSDNGSHFNSKELYPSCETMPYDISVFHHTTTHLIHDLSKDKIIINSNIQIITEGKLRIMGEHCNSN